MDNLLKYLDSEKNGIDNDLTDIKEKLTNYKFSVEEIDNTIVNLSKNVDSTYEVFSPNAFDQDYNKVEIEKLKLRKSEILLDVDKLINRQKMLFQKKKDIETAIKDSSAINDKLVNSEITSRNELNSKIIQKENDFKFNTINLLEMQINKQNHYINNNFADEFKMIENKLKLCENFIDMDINRAKLEIIRLSEEISNFNSKVDNEMFHVKHSGNFNRYNLNEELKKFLSKYKKNCEFKIDYKYLGTKIVDEEYKIINLIRIMKEAIDNSIAHSSGNIINITVSVDEFAEFLSDNIEIQDSNSSDLHQINLADDNVDKIYSVTVKISDNGNGFSINSDDILLQNNMYGIYLMKNRASLMNAQIKIESEPGLGTSVTLIYDCK